MLINQKEICHFIGYFVGFCGMASYRLILCLHAFKTEFLEIISTGFYRPYARTVTQPAV